MTTIKSLSTFFFLCVTLILTAQTDTSIVSKQIDELLATGKIITTEPKAPQPIVMSLMVGTRSIFYPVEKYLDGTDKNYISNVNWIPWSFKIDKFLMKRYSMGLSINMVNNQRIYDAIWFNGSTNKKEKHRFTIKQMRLSFLWRQNLYLVKTSNFDFYWGLGFGLAIYDSTKEVKPDSYEYGGSGELDFIQIVGLETYFGMHYYPSSKIPLGIIVEGGLMQSLGRFGISYRISK